MLRIFSQYLYFFLVAIFLSFLLIKVFFPEVTISENILYLPALFLLPLLDIYGRILIQEKLFEENIFAYQKNIYGYSIVLGVGILSYIQAAEFFPFLCILFLTFGIIFKGNPKIPFSAAVLLLLYILFYLILGYQNRVEILSIYMYYFLVIGVIFQITETLFPRHWILGK